MNKISGLVCVRNGIELDYAFREAILSLVPCCHEVVVCDSDSDDGTTEAIEELCKTDSRVRRINRPWVKPNRDAKWWVDWLNWARERVSHPMLLQLDADEILDSSGYGLVQEAANNNECRWFWRNNYWQHPFQLAAKHEICGYLVVRLLPSVEYLCSDEPCLWGPGQEYPIRLKAGWGRNGPEEFADPRLLIHHLGFLRRNESMFKKVETVNTGFFGEGDKRLHQAEAEGKNWMHYVVPNNPPRPYTGGHPQLMVDWCRARGYTI